MTKFDGDNFKEIFQIAIAPATTAEDIISLVESIGPGIDENAISKVYKLWIETHNDSNLCYAVMFNYAVVQANIKNFSDAIQTLEKSIKLYPTFFPSYINLGNYLEMEGDLSKAVASWSKVTELLPSITNDNISFKTTALNQIGRVLETSHLDALAEIHLENSIMINPRQPEVIQHWVALRQRQCSWPIFKQIQNIKPELLMREISPLSLACYVDDPIYQLSNAFRYNREQIGFPDRHSTAKDFVSIKKPASKLKIGYVSSDFREHAVGFAVTDVIETHNRDCVEIYCYYCGSISWSDPIKERIRNSADHWIDISSISDDEAYAIIRDDQINILVDLNGYTKDARTKLFAMRPAPINVNWFGFPGSMASPYHHYIIADDVTIPIDFEYLYSEKVLRLPCYQPNDRKRKVSSARPSRTDCGLPQHAIVYCSFNGMQKLNLSTFLIWIKILHKVPNSVLWLLSGGNDADQRIRSLLKDNSISQDRLIFAEKKSNPEHLARISLADIFLDSMPYGAHTTASDSLFMGVPIITVEGVSFSARVCSSVLRAAELGELVCCDVEQYTNLAVLLGSNPKELNKIRSKIRHCVPQSILFNTKELVGSLEALYKEMWNDYLTDNLYQPDLRNLDIYNQIAIKRTPANGEINSLSQIEKIYCDMLINQNEYAKLNFDSILWRQNSLDKADI